MKKILFFSIIILLPVIAMAQKKVAVMEVKAYEGVKPMHAIMIRGGMETAVGNAKGYEVYDRSNFEAIMQEQNFQRSGAVKDTDIKRLGEIAGVQYIIVPEAAVDGNEVYINVRMLDVETGKFGGIHDKLCQCNAADIKQACEELGAELFGSGSTVLATNPNYLTITVNGVSFDMASVKGGSFVMGCTGGDCYKNELPTHRVTLSSYYIGVYEVTQDLWKAVMEEDAPCKRQGDKLPVVSVNWNNAQAFIRKLNSLTGRNFRLPTEAEWEYAAKGGAKSKGCKYSGSNTAGEVAWTKDNSDRMQPVGTKKPNELGVYDMSGNVWEWCYDLYANYSDGEQTNPTGPSVGSKRCVRGGAYTTTVEANSCRVRHRAYTNPDEPYSDVGFRLVLIL